MSFAIHGGKSKDAVKTQRGRCGVCSFSFRLTAPSRKRRRAAAPMCVPQPFYPLSHPRSSRRRSIRG